MTMGLQTRQCAARRNTTENQHSMMEYSYAGVESTCTIRWCPNQVTLATPPLYPCPHKTTSLSGIINSVDAPEIQLNSLEPTTKMYGSPYTSATRGRQDNGRQFSSTQQTSLGETSAISNAGTPGWTSQNLSHPAPLSCLAVSKDGARIITGGTSLRVWDRAAPEAPIHKLHLGLQIQSLDVSHDGSQIVMAVIKGARSRRVIEIVIWDTVTGKLRSMGSPSQKFLAVLFLGDGSRVATGGDNGVHIWSVEGQILSSLEAGPGPGFSALALSSEDSHIAAGGNNGMIEVWRVADGGCVCSLGGHRSIVTELVFTRNGDGIISRSADNEVRVWDLETRTSIFVQSTSRKSQGISISPDGTLFAFGWGMRVYVLDLSQKAVVAILEGHTQRISTMAFLQDGNGLVSGCEDGSLRIWNRDLSIPLPTTHATRYMHQTPPIAVSTTGFSLPTVSTETLSVLAAIRSRSGVPHIPRREIRNQASSSALASFTTPHNNLPARSTPFSASMHVGGHPPARQPPAPFNNATEVEDLSRGQWCEYLPSDKSLRGRYRKRTTDAHANGGFSDVWMCDAEISGSPVVIVAVKELRTTNLTYISDREVILKRMLKRLEREVMTWMKLDHPHIVPLIGYRFQPKLCLISPWYSNGSLKRWVRNHPDANKRDLLRQVANGVSYLHSLSTPIVHGDIKADNVLVNDEGNAVISDFGLCEVMEEFTGTSSITRATNPRRLAPELSGGDGRRTLASDVYAYGCLVLEVATGALPYRGLTDTQLYQPINAMKSPASDVSIYPELPPTDGLWKLMSYCWNPEPEKRLTISAVEFALQFME